MKDISFDGPRPCGSRQAFESEFLLAYEYSPLSNIFVGTNFKDFTDVNHMGDNIELFAKIGYLWRL